MASNPYVNKVQLADGTSIIDISDTTAVASDVLNSKYFYTASGQKVQGTATGGGTPAISVVDTLDSNGGAIRTITSLDISDTTAIASDVATGKYFYTASGIKTAGTASGGGGGTPSATQHSIYFEFTDNTNTTIPVYYDDALIGTMITAYTPSTYGQKTVSLAQLDNVTWYTRPVETWETIYNEITIFNVESDPTIPPYCWISSLADVNPTVGSVWRVTFNNVEYRLTAFSVPDQSYADHGAIGNTKYLPGDGIDDGSGVPFGLYHTPWGAWSGAADLQPYTQSSSVSLKIERLVTV